MASDWLPASISSEFMPYIVISSSVRNLQVKPGTVLQPLHVDIVLKTLMSCNSLWKSKVKCIALVNLNYLVYLHSKCLAENSDPFWKWEWQWPLTFVQVATVNKLQYYCILIGMKSYLLTWFQVIILYNASIASFPCRLGSWMRVIGALKFIQRLGNLLKS